MRSTHTQGAWIGLSLTLLLAACSEYTATRVYIPKQSDAGQLEVEVAPAQTHVGYSVTKNFALHLGGYYNDLYASLNDHQYSGELGLHYMRLLDEQVGLQLGVGGEYTDWAQGTIESWRNALSRRTVYQNVVKRSKIIRPFAQLALTIFVNQNSDTQRRSALTLFTRLHNPFFTSKDMQEALPKPLWLDLGVSADFKLSGGFGFYVQVYSTQWLRQPWPDDLRGADAVYKLPPIGGSFGLSYLWGGSSDAHGGSSK